MFNVLARQHYWGFSLVNYLLACSKLVLCKDFNLFVLLSKEVLLNWLRNKQQETVLV
jgi:hypothetical protein